MFDFFTWQTLVGYLISLGVGIALKKWPRFMNEFIPAVHILIGILTQIVNAAMNPGAPEPVTGLMTHHAIMQAGFFSSKFFHVLVQALLQAFAANGNYQTPKSIAVGLQKVGDGEAIISRS